MSRYSSSIYGNDFYGNPAPSGFQVEGFTAEATNYNTVTVSWLNSSGDWDRLRLVRSAYGFPAHETDGVVLLDRNSGPSAIAPRDASVGDYVDVSLVQGRYYYTLFLRATTGTRYWARAGDAFGISVDNAGYLEHLLDRLPSVFTANPDGGDRKDTQLADFLSVPAFHLTDFRFVLDGLLDVNDPDFVPGALLPSLMSQLGYAYEPEIGMRQNRVLARNAAYLSKTKGTGVGIAGLASSVTGFSTSVLPMINLLLTQDDSSADRTIGAWVPTGGILVRDPLASPDADSGLSTYSQLTTEINRVGVFKLTVTGSTPASVLLGAPSPVRTGIPVTASQTYTISAYFRTNVSLNSRQPTMAFRWYDKAGALISSSTSAALTASSNTAWVRNAWTASAPSTAMFAAVEISWPSPGANQVQYFDAVQFQQAAAATAYRTPRRVEVVLEAERVNEIINGGFDLNITGFDVTGGSAAHTTTGTFDTGVGALNLTTSAGTATLSQSNLIVDPDRAFAAQGKFLHTTGGALSVTIDVQYFTAAGVAISAQTGAIFTNAGAQTSWIRPAFLGRTPATCGKATVRFTITTISGSVIRSDDLLAEHGDSIEEYFDQRNNSGDVIFEGLVNGSRVHLYRILGVKRQRFLELALDSLPLGAEINTVVARPR